MEQFPIGGIAMYSGGIIPYGWALCDGENGTPDLTGKMIVGGGEMKRGGNDKKKCESKKEVHEGERESASEDVRSERIDVCFSLNTYSLAYIMFIGNN